VAEIARAGIAKQPAQAIRHSVFSRLFNSDNAVIGSAGLVPYRLAALLRKETPLTALPNTCNASLATAKVKPSPLAVYDDFVMYNK